MLMPSDCWSVEGSEEEDRAQVGGGDGRRREGSTWVKTRR